MKLTDIINEEKYTIIDPKGNPTGTGTKDQANQRQKKLGGSKKGYFVVPAKSALKARRAMEKYNFDFRNAKLQDMMSDLYFENISEELRPDEVEFVANKLGNSMPNHTNYDFDKGPDEKQVLNALKKYHRDFFRHSTTKQKKEIVKLVQKITTESINEGASSEEKRIVMAAIKKIAKYRNVPLHFAVNDVIRAAEELERTIGKK